MAPDVIAAEEFLEGKVLLFDKPLHWTSFDIVNKVKQTLKHKLHLKKIKVGHAGTLDPLASGLLIVCTGRKTKEIESFQHREKEYTGKFFVGKTTPSFDLETQPCEENFPIDHITEELILQTSQKFMGEIRQVPPIFSAKKIDGKRAYESARKGEETIMRANMVQIDQFEISEAQLPLLSFRVVCGKGTYIRSLAHDFGQALGSAAYLKELRRTRIGDFKVEQAWSIDDFLLRIPAEE